MLSPTEVFSVMFALNLKDLDFFISYTAWKVSKYGVISGPYFPVFGLNTRKYGPEITPKNYNKKNYSKKDIGLYRDDGLAIFKNVSGSKAEKIKKDIQKLFKENYLNITIHCNLKIFNYLAVTFNRSNAPTFLQAQQQNRIYT